MSFVAGANTADTMSVLTDGRAFALGDRFMDGSGREWVFVRATANIAAGDVVTFDETHAGVVAPLGTANDARGDRIGVPAVAITSGDYGWLQIYGPCSAINVLASCAANVRLNTTGTAGSLDDDGTAGSMEAFGIFLTTARAASNGPAPGILSYPFIGVTI